MHSKTPLHLEVRRVQMIVRQKNALAKHIRRLSDVPPFKKWKGLILRTIVLVREAANNLENSFRIINFPSVFSFL